MLNLTDWVIRAVAVLAAIVVHEYAHGWMADSFGDPTPRQSGRLTLNPLVHLDPIGTLMLLFFRFGWAKPVPINPAYFRDRRRGLLLVSLAGPASNLLFAFVAMALFKVVVAGPVGTLGLFLITLMRFNVWFALFNLIPVPPLDGSRIVGIYLRGPLARMYWEYQTYGWLVLMLLIGTGAVGAVLGPLSLWVFRLFDQLTFFLG